MKGKYNIPLFVLLLAILFIKVSALHVYSHIEEDANAVEDCRFCELAIENQQSEVDIPNPLSSPTPQFIFYAAHGNYGFYMSFVSDGIHLQNYCRPPPYMV